MERVTHIVENAHEVTVYEELTLMLNHSQWYTNDNVKNYSRLKPNLFKLFLML